MLYCAVASLGTKQRPRSRQKGRVCLQEKAMIKFTPPLGALCVSSLVSDTSLVLLYCFRDVEDDPHHYQAICEMSEFVVRPCDSGYVFTNLDVARVDGTIPAPVVVHRHLCTWQELCAIKQLWQRPSGLSGSSFSTSRCGFAALCKTTKSPRN